MKRITFILLWAIIMPIIAINAQASSIEMSVVSTACNKVVSAYIVADLNETFIGTNPNKLDVILDVPKGAILDFRHPLYFDEECNYVYPWPSPIYWQITYLESDTKTDRYLLSKSLLTFPTEFTTRITIDLSQRPLGGFELFCSEEGDKLFNIVSASMKVDVFNIPIYNISRDCVYSKENQSSNISQDINLEISPNPAKDFLNIETNIEESFGLQIFNAQGQIVFEENQIATRRKKIDVSQLDSGLYIMRIEANGIIKQEKLLITD